MCFNSQRNISAPRTSGMRKPTFYGHRNWIHVMGPHCLPEPSQTTDVPMPTCKPTQPKQNHNLLLNLLPVFTIFPLLPLAKPDSSPPEILPVFVYGLKTMNCFPFFFLLLKESLHHIPRPANSWVLEDILSSSSHFCKNYEKELIKFPLVLID